MGTPERKTHHEIVADVQRLTLTVDEAAQVLGIGRNQAYAAVRDGSIPSIRIGKRIVVPRAALDRMLAGEGDRVPV